MNGAETLVHTLVGGGVELCLSNPGTSEMHFVAALDRIPGLRCVLGLFEGVVTGAADGYARMAGKPAATLLHLGGGLSNGLSNLHNAERANTPIVNIVGDQATFHRRHDRALSSTVDIETVVRPFSVWTKTARRPEDVAPDAAEAIVAAQTAPGGVATLILPADSSWGEAKGPAKVRKVPRPPSAAAQTVAEIARILEVDKSAVLLVTGDALRGPALEDASRIARRTGCRLYAPIFNARMERGAGRVALSRIPYPIDQALQALKGVRNLVLVGAEIPVSTFSYPTKPNVLIDADCEMHVLARNGENLPEALAMLADAVGADKEQAKVERLALPGLPTGSLDVAKFGASLAALLPENAIVVDESVTSGRSFYPDTRSARPHDWIQNKGAALGYNLSVAAGAALACPDRKVVALSGDGAALYMPQALWTMAREQLDVLVVVFSNRSYAILRNELVNVGAANPGPRALGMMSIGNPDIDYTLLARSFGVDGVQVTDMDGFNEGLRRGFAQKGPYVVEVVF